MSGCVRVEVGRRAVRPQRRDDHASPGDGQRLVIAARRRVLYAVGAVEPLNPAADADQRLVERQRAQVEERHAHVTAVRPLVARDGGGFEAVEKGAVGHPVLRLPSGDTDERLWSRAPRSTLRGRTTLELTSVDSWR